LWRLGRVWPGFAWAAARRLREVHARTPIDVVEAAECRADGLFLPLLRRRPPVVVRLHTPWYFVDRLNDIVPDRKRRLVYRQESWSIRGAEVVTAPSRAVVELTDTWVPLKRRAVSVVPNPVNAARYSPDPEPRADEVLVVGRLERRKGAALL